MKSIELKHHILFMHIPFGGHLEWVNYFALKTKLHWTPLHTSPFAKHASFSPLNSPRGIITDCLVTSMHIFILSHIDKLCSKTFNKIWSQQQFISKDFKILSISFCFYVFIQESTNQYWPLIQDSGLNWRKWINKRPVCA